MTFIQKFIMTILPKSWGTAIRHESENWLFHCPSCDSSFSVWGIGGIRYKAASKGKKALVRCPNCTQTQMMPLEYHKPDNNSLSNLQN